MFRSIRQWLVVESLLNALLEALLQVFRYYTDQDQLLLHGLLN